MTMTPRANTKADLRGCINVLRTCLDAARRKNARLERENERLRKQIKPRQMELQEMRA